MNLNPNPNANDTNSPMTSVHHGAQRMANALGLGAAAVGTRVPFAPPKAPPRKMIPVENNPLKNAYRDSLSKMSPEAARELLLQRKASLGGLLGGILGSAAKPN